MENVEQLPDASPTLIRLCRTHLPYVSRTFALTIPVLQEPLCSYVGLAYLLCRVADTAEDHPLLEQGQRDEWLVHFEQLLTSDETASPPRWIPYPEPHFQSLFEAAPKLFQARADLPAPVKQAIDSCLVEMLRGMRRFPARNSGHFVQACTTLEELDRYCHVVAGTVGILLTGLFAQRLGASWATPGQIERGRRFGLGLQLVNILKDRAGDRDRGISYCPDLDPKTTQGLSVLVVKQALDHLQTGHAFLRGIPSHALDLHEFCLIPHTLALHTLSHLLEGRNKVPREELQALLAQIQGELENHEARERSFQLNRDRVLRQLSRSLTTVP